LVKRKTNYIPSKKERQIIYFISSMEETDFIACVCVGLDDEKGNVLMERR